MSAWQREAFCLASCGRVSGVTPQLRRGNDFPTFTAYHCPSLASCETFDRHFARLSHKVSACVMDTINGLYSPLPPNHIRLLNVLPGRSGNIECVLESVDMNTRPTYNALSYTWGDPLATELAPVDNSSVDLVAGRLVGLLHRLTEGARKTGMSSPSRDTSVIINGIRKPVTPNLCSALLRLRQPDLLNDTPIWIDAICINQADLTEKAVQVAIMGRIYNEAECVMAWLGESDQHTSTAMSVIEYLSTIPDAAFDSHRAVAPNLPWITPDRWASFLALLSRSYFKRVWMIQEISLANKFILVCGPHILGKPTVNRGLRYCADTQLIARFSTHCPEYREIVSQYPGTGGALLDPLAGRDASALPAWPQRPERSLYGLVKGAAATDKRDLVYGLYGLLAVHAERSKFSLANLPPVSYDLSNTLEDVLVAWAHFMFCQAPEEHEDYKLFGMVEDRSQRALQTLPSWVPDLTTKDASLASYSAAGHRSAPWTPSGSKLGGRISSTDDPRRITLQAAKFDKIEAVASPFNVGKESGIQIFLMCDFISNVAMPYANRLDALARTITADPDPHEVPPATVLAKLLFTRNEAWKDPYNYLPLYNWLVDLGLHSHVRIPPDPLTWISDRTAPRFGENYRTRTEQTITTKTLFRTERHYLGIAGQSVEVGDKIMVFRGASPVYVVRRVKDQTFEMMSRAYVHGIMQGEVANDLKWQEIELI